MISVKKSLGNVQTEFKLGRTIKGSVDSIKLIDAAVSAKGQQQITRDVREGLLIKDVSDLKETTE